MQTNILVITALICRFAYAERTTYDETEARNFLKEYNELEIDFAKERTNAQWEYESNINNANLEKTLAIGSRYAEHVKKQWKEASKFPWKTFKDPDMVRQFSKIVLIGKSALSPEKFDQLERIISEMSAIYGKATVCEYKNSSNCDIFLEPGITERFVNSRDPEELKHYWKAWRDASGKKVRSLFPKYVDLSNEAARLNNFTNNAEFWISLYESDDFPEVVESLWQQLRPLYLQLHAYVRRRLNEFYGEDVVSKMGPIPAHLFGNVWAQDWENIYSLTTPYPNKTSLDVTQAMIDQGYTPLKMFKLSEEFFVSLNLSRMTDTFWNKSLIERPTDGRDLICHASAWEFGDGDDFRVKMCTVVSLGDLKTVHHEMGHIEYFMQYKDQPFVYRDGANAGFHEAIGDTMALSVSTPKHLRQIGLLNSTENDEPATINQLFLNALQKIAFLPFGYMIDKYRWSIFRGETTPEDYNCKWWQLREQYQGLEPPVDRNEDDFDAGAKYHVVADVRYIRYFVSFVIQFQFHKALCEAAGEYNATDPNSKPLYECDIYQSQEAGKLLKDVLAMGSSKPWPEAMKAITGKPIKDASALLEYFSPLQKWLEAENQRTGEHIGWEPSKRVCSSSKV